MDFAGLASLLAATGVLVASLAAAYVSIVNTNRIKNTLVLVEQIDHAVNGKPEGAQSLQSQVDDIHIGQQPAVLPLVRVIEADVKTLLKNGEK